MTLASPIWLLLTIPLGIFMLMRPMPTRIFQLIRAITLVLIVLALAGLAIKLPSRAGTVVVVADRSLSMPPEADQRHRETIEIIEKGMAPSDRIGIVAFASEHAVKQAAQNGRFGQFKLLLDRNASNLSDALDAGLALIPKHSPGRLMLLSDGRQTGRIAAGSAARAASRSIAIDFRSVARPVTNDLTIERIRRASACPRARRT